MWTEQIAHSFISGTLFNKVDDDFQKFYTIKYGRFCNYLTPVNLTELLLSTSRYESNTIDRFGITAGLTEYMRSWRLGGTKHNVFLQNDIKDNLRFIMTSFWRHICPPKRQSRIYPETVKTINFIIWKYHYINVLSLTEEILFSYYSELGKCSELGKWLYKFSRHPLRCQEVVYFFVFCLTYQRFWSTVCANELCTAARVV